MRYAAFITTLTALLCSACAVGPRYKPPSAPVPAAFKEQPARDSTVAAEWQAARPRDDAIRTNWWEAFQDPVLNALEEQVAVSNQTVAQAEAQFRAARAAIRGVRADLFPTVTAGTSVTVSHASLSGSADRITAGTNTVFQLPIASLVETVFDGGRRRSIKEQAVANFDNAFAMYRQNVLTAFQEVEDNLAAVRVLADESTQAADAVASANRSLALATNRYTAGVTTYLEVITAQAIALRNQISAVDVTTRRTTASVLLVKALGGGWSGG
jgi:outer membrane protein TolC